MAEHQVLDLAVGGSSPSSPAAPLIDLDAIAGEVMAEYERLWPRNEIEHQALALAEEAGEVARAILKRHEGTRATPEYWTDQVRKELGQTLLVTIGMIGLEGHLVTELLLETLEHLKSMRPDDRKAEE